MEYKACGLTNTSSPQKWIVTGSKEDGKGEVRERKDTGAVGDIGRDLSFLSTKPAVIGTR